MLSKLIISQDLETQKQTALRELEKLVLTQNHPDLMWVEDEGKIGVEEMKKVREHFSFKPYSAKGKAAVIISAENLTPDAQNSLLKTLEEPPESGSLILTASSESAILPTILSRCEIVQFGGGGLKVGGEELDKVEQLINSGVEERFKIVEQTEEKDKLLESLTFYIHNELPNHPERARFAKLLVQAAQWQKSNVSIRTILEYLMLEL